MNGINWNNGANYHEYHEPGADNGDNVWALRLMVIALAVILALASIGFVLLLDMHNHVSFNLLLSGAFWRPWP